MRLVIAFVLLANASYARRVLAASERQAPDSLETLLLAMSPIVAPRVLSSAQSSPALRMNLNEHRGATSQSRNSGIGNGATSQSRNSVIGNSQMTSRTASQTSQAVSPFEKLNAYNNEMVNSIQDLCKKRDESDRQIQAAKEEKTKIQHQLSTLTDRLKQLDKVLSEKTLQRKEYQNTIQETEEAYKKIVKSSQDLVQLLKRETVTLTSKKSDTPSEEAPLGTVVKPPQVQKAKTSKTNAKRVKPPSRDAAIDDESSQSDDEIRAKLESQARFWK